MAIRKKGDLAAVATVPLIMTLGNSMLIPVLPSFQSKLGITALQSSLVITVYSVVAIVFIPLAGYLSDRFGRKKVIIPSLALAGLGGLISGLAVWLLQNGSAYVPLLAGRLIQGIGAAGAFPIAIPLIGDMFEREDEVSKGLGLVETANTFGKVLSPILGSLLAAWYLYAPLLSVPLLCAASVIMVWLMVKVPEDKGGRQEKPPAFRSFVREVMRLLREKGRWVYAVFALGAIGMFALFAMLVHLSDVLEHSYRFDGVLKGLLLAIPLSGLCLMSSVTGKIIGGNKQRMKHMALTGLIVASSSLLLMAWLMSKPLWALLAAASAAGVGIGAALPCLDAFITEGIDKAQRGTVSAFYGSMRFVGVAAGPPFAAALSGRPSVLYTALAACVAAGVILIVICIRPRQALRLARPKAGLP